MLESKVIFLANTSYSNSIFINTYFSCVSLKRAESETPFELTSDYTLILLKKIISRFNICSSKL